MKLNPGDMLKATASALTEREEIKKGRFYQVAAVSESGAFIRLAGHSTFISPHNFDRVDAQDTLNKAEEHMADLRSQMEYLFDLRSLTEKDLVPTTKEAIENFLRVCRVGGMPTETLDLVKDQMFRFTDLYLPDIVATIVRTTKEQAG